MQTETRTNASTKHTGAKPLGKPEVKHTVLHADKKSDIKVDGKTDPALKDWTIFLTAGPGGDLSQQVICRPIGNVPGTTAKSYVMIQADHVKSYVANAQNPLELAANMELAKARDVFYTNHGLYTKSKDGALLWGTTPVADLWREAKKVAEQAFKDAKESYYAAEEKGGKFRPNHSSNPSKDKTAAPFPGKMHAVTDYLPKEFKEELEMIEKKWKKSAEFDEADGARKKALDQYETRGGPDGTAPQKALTWLEGVPPKLVKQYLNRFLWDPAGVQEEIRIRYGTDSSAK